jgi:hypothetical protein
MREMLRQKTNGLANRNADCILQSHVGTEFRPANGIACAIDRFTPFVESEE